MELEGTVTDGLILPDTGTAPLDEGTRVIIIAPDSNPVGRSAPVSQRPVRISLAELLKDFKGVIDDMPADYAEQVDHYLYGTPKR